MAAAGIGGAALVGPLSPDAVKSFECPTGSVHGEYVRTTGNPLDAEKEDGSRVLVTICENERYTITAFEGKPVTIVDRVANVEISPEELQ